MLGEGDRLPEAAIWLESRERTTLRELAGGRPLVFFFYLFDWSST
jgi:peroxiredoxin